MHKHIGINAHMRVLFLYIKMKMSFMLMTFFGTIHFFFYKNWLNEVFQLYRIEGVNRVEFLLKSPVEILDYFLLQTNLFFYGKVGRHQHILMNLKI